MPDRLGHQSAVISVDTKPRLHKTVVTTTTTTTTFAPSSVGPIRPTDENAVKNIPGGPPAKFPLATVDTPPFLKKFTFRSHDGQEGTFSELNGDDDHTGAVLTCGEKKTGEKRPADDVCMSPAPKRPVPDGRRRVSFLEDTGSDDDAASSPLAASLLSPSVSPVSDSLQVPQVPQAPQAPQASQASQASQAQQLPPQVQSQPHLHSQGRVQQVTTTRAIDSPSEIEPMLSIPGIINSFDALPDGVKRYTLFNILRRCDRPTLSMMSSVILPALRRDLLSNLPVELAYNVLSYLDSRSLLRASAVSKSWKSLVDSADWVWRDLLRRDKFVMDPELESLLQRRRQRTQLHAGLSGADKSRPGSVPTPVHTPTLENNSEASLYREIYRRKYLNHRNWMNPQSRPRHISFNGHNNDVVTCLQFDDDKIVTGSDDSTINVYDTNTGQLRCVLEGHVGGVWALQNAGPNMVVSGSTDRTVRVWNVAQQRCTHVFSGHTSTVRCLDILHPVPVVDKATGTTKMMPPYPLIVTGSRDATLRIYRVPSPSDPDFLPDVDVNNNGNNGEEDNENPYFVRALTGHTHNVRVVAGYGDTIVSGSYDTTVRVWNASTGRCRFELLGHSHRVYSIQLDHERNRCISGSFDYMIKIWCLETGSLLHNLEGHTSLVGLLELNNNLLVSGAADSTLRVWNPDTGEPIYKLRGHRGPITCFQHDHTKIVSGSEDTLKLWDIRTGKPVRDLLTDLTSIWQVKFDRRRCVAAVQRESGTCIEILDFDYSPEEENAGEASIIRANELDDGDNGQEAQRASTSSTMSLSASSSRDSLVQSHGTSTTTHRSTTSESQEQLGELGRHY
uniref:ARAD1A19756p n=1 Tax=Blastobotrys adeninivorans TaxID=409370 RepID=A0A060SYU2_BLAAD